MRREHAFALVNVGLTQVDVELDGEWIGSAVELPHARRPKKWKRIDRHGIPLEGGYRSGQEAALALIDHELDRKLSERIVRSLSS